MESDLPELEAITGADGTTLGWALRPVGGDVGADGVRAAVADGRADGVSSPARFDMTRAALVEAGYVVLMGNPEIDVGTEPLVARSAELGWINPDRVFGLGTLGDDDARLAIPAGEPREPLAGLLFWSPQAFSRTPDQIQMTLDWLDKLTSPGPDGGPQ